MHVCQPLGHRVSTSSFITLLSCHRSQSATTTRYMGRQQTFEIAVNNHLNI
jgi:hypothetical protein